MLEYWAKLDPKPKLWLVPPIICLPRLFNLNHTVSNRIFGHWVCCFMKCVLSNLLLMLKVYTNLHKKLYKENMQTFHLISAKTFINCWVRCWIRTRTKDQTSIVSWSFRLFKREFECFWMKMILKMSLVIQSYIIKTFLMSLELLSNRKKNKN